MSIKLSKAIEILTVMNKEKVYLLNPDGGDAVALGIEGLKRIQRVKTTGDLVGPGPLPSEAPENDKDTSFRHNAHSHHDHWRNE